MKVFHYSYDYHGVSHLRQAITRAEQVAVEFPEATQLLVSGMPQPRNTKLPHKLDMIKLPGMDMPFQERYSGLPSVPTTSLREEIIWNALRHFDPDVVFMDESSMEARGEMTKVMDRLKLERPETKLVIRLHKIEGNTTTLRHVFPSKNRMASSPDLTTSEIHCEEGHDVETMQGHSTSSRYSAVT